MVRLSFVCILTCWLALSAISQARADDEAPTIRLTTLEWPPYTSQHLPEGGLITSLLRDALNQAGFQLEVRFRPWRRALAEAQFDPSVHGYFPEYYAAEVAQRFDFSIPVGVSPVGFAHRRDAPFDWQTLDDLKHQRIGVVDGYVNSGPFDRAWKSEDLAVEPTSSDAMNLRRLAAGHIDAAIIDPLVMSYLIATQRPEWRTVLRFHPKPLNFHSLHVCLRHEALSQADQQAINQALASIDHNAQMKRYLNALGEQLSTGYLPEDSHMPLIMRAPSKQDR